MNRPLFVDPIHSWWDRTRAALDRADALRRQGRWLSRGRVLIVAFAAGMAFVLRSDPSGWWWLLLPAAGFVALAIVHDRVLRRTLARRHVAELYHRAAKRVDRDDEEEAGDPKPVDILRTGKARPRRPSQAEEDRISERLRRLRRLGDVGLDPHLDLFGVGQLFDRVADWRTDAGGETLGRWMLHPADPDEVRARQAAIRELTPRDDLRERVAATGALTPWPIADFSMILTWLGPPSGGVRDRVVENGEDEVAPFPFPAPPAPRLRRLLAPVCLLLTLAMGAGLAGWLGGAFGPLPFVVAVWLALGVGLANRTRVRRHERTSTHVAREVQPLLEAARILGGEEFDPPRLGQLRERLTDAAAPLRHLQRLARTMPLRRNPMFAPIAAFLFWGTHHERALDRWRQRHGAPLRQWREAAGEFDALLGLAQYAAERPGHVFPSFDDVPGLEAVHLGHPLIPEGRLQRNSVRLGRGGPEILVVTGSNMAGKSTLLRAIGTNVILARMGAPVAASRLVLGPLSLGASIAVQDSLQDGVSRFLAELLALRRVLETGSPEEPLLFLLDEVLGGTNSSDRRLAAQALVEELGRRGAVGILTTHDLTLAELEHELPGRVRNMHFRERISGEQMEFDYQLRDGPIRRGNALDLMRMLRLPAPGTDSGEFTSLPDGRRQRDH